MHSTADALQRSKPVAKSFVEARLAASPLRDYPGTMPTDLAAAYSIQDIATQLWPDEVAGWKVGRITGDAVETYGEDRLVGPIFSRSVKIDSTGTIIPLPAIRGGFAAVEGEFLLRLGADAPAGKTDWTVEEARTITDEVFCGIELAGSPFPGINDHGPCVTISDFGNNAGLIVGPVFDGWQDKPMSAWSCETWIDGDSVGTGTAAAMPGGAFESLRFALMRCAERGLPLKKGQLISTGAISGVHAIEIGQGAKVRFGDGTTLECVMVPQTA